MTHGADERRRTGRFETTSWSLVLAAAASNDAIASSALGDLCSRYWFPVYAFIRRRGHSREEAEDLTQAFFERLLAKGILRHADRERGRFRSFLLSSLTNFLSNEHDREIAEKRGGGRPTLSLDFDSADALYRRSAVSPADPEREFARHWAATVLQTALEQLRVDLESQGRADDLELLDSFLTTDAARGEYERLAAKRNTTAGALRVAVHRLRARFRDDLRRLIAETIRDEGSVDDEIRFLIGAFS